MSTATPRSLRVVSTSPGSAFDLSPMSSRSAPRSPEDHRRDFAVAELEGELEQLRRKAAAQEESLHKYRIEAAVSSARRPALPLVFTIYFCGLTGG